MFALTSSIFSTLTECVGLCEYEVGCCWQEKTHTLCCPYLNRQKLIDTLADGDCGRERRTVSGVKKAMVESRAVEEAVRKVSIHKQAFWTTLH